MIEEALAKDDDNLMKFKLHDVENLPFESNYFDTVVDTFSLQSYYDRSKAISEIKRVLKPGGKLLVIGQGASSYKWYNDYLKLRAGLDLKTYGCVYHLDLQSILEQDPDFEV